MLIVNMKAQAITSNKYNFYIKLYQQSFLAWIVQFLWKKDHIRQKALIR